MISGSLIAVFLAVLVAVLIGGVVLLLAVAVAINRAVAASPLSPQHPASTREHSSSPLNMSGPLERAREAFPEAPKERCSSCGNSGSHREGSTEYCSACGQEWRPRPPEARSTCRPCAAVRRALGLGAP